MVARKRGSKGSRKSNARKGRRSTRNRKCGGMWGGNPNSLAQGQQFLSAHGNQHGGAHTPLGGSSLTESSMALPPDLREMAKVSGGDASFRDIAGLRDSDQVMSGGRRRGSSRKSRKGSKSRKNNMRKSRKNNMRKSRKNNMRKSRKNNMRKSRKNNMRKSRRGSKSQRGGAYTNVSGAPYGGDSMLLSPSEAARAGTADFSNPLVKH